MNLASFFTGIGGFDVAFQRAGFETTVMVEIDANCRKLLGKKFSALIVDDILKIAAAHRRIRLGKPLLHHAHWQRLFTLLRNAVVWCGGFPCQDLSVAGARAGLAGERSGLWFAFRRLIALFRPKWLVVENVPGLLSSQQGRDFAVILSGLEQLGYGISWRVFDAQYAGLAQRRERVFIVASLGTLGCAEILFESEGVCWDTPPSREAGQRTARPIAAGSVGGSRYRNDADTADNLIDGVVGALNDGAHNGGGSTVRTLTPDESSLPDVAWALQERDAKGADSSTKEGHLIPMHQGGFFDGPTHTLRGEGFDASEDGTGRGTPLVPIAFTSKDHGADASDISPTLRSMGHKDSQMNGGGQVAIAFNARQDPDSWDERTGSLDTDGTTQGVQGVRRLTPVECERLQGFDDGWTAGFADSVRYRMLGNSVAIPCVEWIAQRIAQFLKRPTAEAASGNQTP